MTVFVVTYCPMYAEYRNQISVKKVFMDEEKAQKFIEQETVREVNSFGVSGDYDIEEIELVE